MVHHYNTRTSLSIFYMSKLGKLCLGPLQPILFHSLPIWIRDIHHESFLNWFLSSSYLFSKKHPVFIILQCFSDYLKYFSKNDTIYLKRKKKHLILKQWINQMKKKNYFILRPCSRFSTFFYLDNPFST